MKRINWFPLLVIIAIASAVAIVWFLQTISNNTSVSLGKKFSQTILPKSGIQNENENEIVWPDPETIDGEVIKSLSPEIREKISQSPVPVLLPTKDVAISGFSITNTGYIAQFESEKNTGYIAGQLSDNANNSSLNRENTNIYQTEVGWNATWYERGKIVYLIHLSCSKDCQEQSSLLSLIESLK